MTERHVVIVGTGAAGISVLENLRRCGFTGSVTMVGDEETTPYDRPPLSKRFLTGEWEPERLHLRSAETLAELAATWLLGRRASSLDAQTRRVFLDDGSAVSYDELVVCTGVRSRRLPLSDQVDGAHVLRTVNDALSLRDGLDDRSELLIVGGGFLGAETAAVASSLGTRVTLLSSTVIPLAAALGEDVAGLLADRHRSNGVHLEQGRAQGVTASSEGTASGIVLDDGRHLPAEKILMSVGSHPNVEWLETSGIPISDGITCDEHGGVVPGVWAAGDVAAWWRPEADRHVRLEHRTNATEHGMNVARAILDQPALPPSVPYVWSDQYDLKIQIHGLTAGADSFEVIEGDVADGRFTAVYGRQGRICAALGVNMMRPLRTLRPHVAEQTPWTELDRLKPALSLS